MAGVGSTPGLLIAAGVGAAASAALEPAFEVPRQDAWSRNQNRILDAQLVARLVAQGGVDLSDGEAEAAREGFSSDKFDQLVYLAQTVPGVSEAMHLWRIGLLTDALFSHVLVKAGLDQRYAGPILSSKLFERPGLGDIAYGVVRGILPAPGYVPVPPPTGGTSVPRFPPLSIDPEELAAQIGFSPEMLHLMVGRSGLSLAPGLAAQALFRGLINENDFLLAIAEGDLRTEWAETLRDATRQIPTSGEFAELWLRGWITQSEAEAGAAKHGMSARDLDLLYKVRGRPVTFHEITTGLARGGQPDSQYTDIPEPYRTAAQQSDIRPEWASLHYANRYLYPSAFVLRALAQAGDLGDEAAVEQVLLEIGWKPSFAKQVATAWTTGGTSGDSHIGKAQTQLWTAAHKGYLTGELSDAAVTTALEAAGVAATSVPQVLSLWTAERDLVRKSLSAAQTKKAWSEQIPDPATGVPWTEAQAIARLQTLGYSADDAAIFLVE